jgi:hypothetical protein
LIYNIQSLSALIPVPFSRQDRREKGAYCGRYFAKNKNTPWCGFPSPAVLFRGREVRGEGRGGDEVFLFVLPG